MKKPVAYFCAEYALDSKLPIYAGGLGILAGDYLHQCADQNFPIVGIGLAYDSCKQKKSPVAKIAVPIQNKKVYAQAFACQIGSTPVYLLSTDLAENDPQDRQITETLYPDNKEIRLKQALILGIGGARLLEALKIDPLLYHLNEGFTAFGGLEALGRKIKKKIVFTNHTLAAGHGEIYDKELAASMLESFAKEIKTPVSELIKLGLIGESSIFCTTTLALRLADKINAVSKLHAQKAADIWKSFNINAVTNGIHINTWDKVKNLKNHQSCKLELLKFIKAKARIKWDENQLLIGWARRFTEYKRPLALLENLDRFLKIARNSQYPINVIFSGNHHENDEPGKKSLQKLQNIIKEKAGDCVAYLPNYNIETAEKLVSGCDVWLNTPIVGYEACGTSGMKAALNGVLPCSTRDGWVAETNLDKTGWALNDDDISESILDVLEKEIAPMYYEQSAEWRQRMINARNLILNQFSAQRMLKDYIEKIYSP